MAVIDSYGTGNRDSGMYVNRDAGFPSNPYRVSQSFTGDGSVLGNVQLYLTYDAEPPSTSLYVKIYAHSGTFGTSSVPTGAALATSDAVDPAVLAYSSYALITFPFSGGNQITLTNGTKYVLVLEAGNDSASVLVGMDGSSPTHGGNAAKDYEEGP